MCTLSIYVINNVYVHCSNNINNKLIVVKLISFKLILIYSRDIFPLMQDPEAFRLCTELFTDRARQLCREHGVEKPVIVGLDARGFILGPIVSQNLETAFVPIRKAGKLPGETVQTSFTLEYGEV